MKKAHRASTLLAAMGLVAAGAFFTSSASASTQTSPESPKGIRAASLTQTVCWPNVTDEQILTWYGAPVTPSQPIVASASEGVLHGEGTGDAHVYSENVTVLPSAVQVRVHTGWSSPLNVCVHFVG